MTGKLRIATLCARIIYPFRLPELEFQGEVRKSNKNRLLMSMFRAKFSVKEILIDFDSIHANCLPLKAILFAYRK